MHRNPVPSSSVAADSGQQAKRVAPSHLKKLAHTVNFIPPADITSLRDYTDVSNRLNLTGKVPKKLKQHRDSKTYIVKKVGHDVEERSEMASDDAKQNPVMLNQMLENNYRAAFNEIWGQKMFQRICQSYLEERVTPVIKLVSSEENEIYIASQLARAATEIGNEFRDNKKFFDKNDKVVNRDIIIHTLCKQILAMGLICNLDALSPANFFISLTEQKPEDSMDEKKFVAQTPLHMDFDDSRFSDNISFDPIPLLRAMVGEVDLAASKIVGAMYNDNIIYSESPSVKFLRENITLYHVLDVISDVGEIPLEDFWHITYIYTYGDEEEKKRAANRMVARIENLKKLEDPLKEYNISQTTTVSPTRVSSSKDGERTRTTSRNFNESEEEDQVDKDSLLKNCDLRTIYADYYKDRNATHEIVVATNDLFNFALEGLVSIGTSLKSQTSKKTIRENIRNFRESFKAKCQEIAAKANSYKKLILLEELKESDEMLKQIIDAGSLNSSVAQSLNASGANSQNVSVAHSHAVSPVHSRNVSAAHSEGEESESSQDSSSESSSVATSASASAPASMPHSASASDDEYDEREEFEPVIIESGEDQENIIDNFIKKLKRFNYIIEDIFSEENNLSFIQDQIRRFQKDDSTEKKDFYISKNELLNSIYLMLARIDFAQTYDEIESSQKFQYNQAYVDKHLIPWFKESDRLKDDVDDTAAKVLKEKIFRQIADLEKGEAQATASV